MATTTKTTTKKTKTTTFSFLKRAAIAPIAAIGVFCHSATAAPVVNFGQNLTALQSAYANRSLHILQIGDSHTAGDYFTEQLRKRLQAEIGDGGIGFAYPAHLSNQRAARHGYGSGWQTFNSRRNEGLDYPLGGVYAQSDGVTPLTITSQYYNRQSQNARLVVKGQAGQKIRVGDQSAILSASGWQIVQAQARFGFDIVADSGVLLGGVWFDKGTGGVVSSMGINGATQSYWRRWRSALAQDLNASRADLVILAYGTNEAFSSDPSSQAADIQYAVDRARQGLPRAAILLVNAPNSLKSLRDCVLPPYLNQARSTIEQAARQNRTLYWDWQEAMGGACAMRSWADRGLAAKDGVHFTRQGYELAANDLYDNLKPLLLGGARYAPAPYQNSQRAAHPSAADPSNSNAQPTGSGRICLGDVCKTL